MATDNENSQPTVLTDTVEETLPEPAATVVGEEIPSIDMEVTVEEPVAEAPQAVVEEKVEEVVKPARPQNASMEAEVFSKLSGEITTSDVILPLPDASFSDTREIVSSLPNINLDTSEKERDWINVFRASNEVGSVADVGVETLNREGADFRQTVQSEKGPLSIAQPNFSNMSDTMMTGERAVLRIRALTGMGSIMQIPLWHSGFWLTIKAPSDAALLELNRRLVEEKIEIGRRTHGLAFGNTSVFFAGWIMDFALQHMYETTCKPDVDWRSRISSLDVPLIAWGLACAIWPRGFPYARSVMKKDSEEFKVIREKINIGKILWTDTSALTPWQVSHMAQRRGAHMTNEMLDRYQKEFTRGQGRTVKLSDKIALELATPTLDEYLTSGQKWVNNIVLMVDKAFGMPPGDAARNSYITDQAKATNMRQFGHWVKAVHVEGNVIEDVDTVEQTLDALSSIDDFRQVYFEGIQKYIEDSTISIVAVPATEETDNPSLPRFPHLLPIDALSVFFILLGQKVQRIQARG